MIYDILWIVLKDIFLYGRVSRSHHFRRRHLQRHQETQGEKSPRNRAAP